MSAHHKTISAVFVDFESAADAVRALEAAGFTAGDIAIVTSKPGEHASSNLDVTEHPASINAEELEDAVKEGGVGALVGGAVGLLAGLSVIVIPGFGPILAGGWLLSTAAGASFGMAGGLAASLVHAGHLTHHADEYVAAVRDGGTLVAVRCTDAQIAQVEALMMAGKTALPFEVKA